MLVNLCDSAHKRWSAAHTWKNLWTGLLFVFGVVLVIFATVALLFYVQASWLPAALSAAGAVVDFGGASWLVKQRAGIVAEEKSAFKAMAKYCPESLALQVLEEAGAKKRLAQLKVLYEAGAKERAEQLEML